MCVSSVLVVGNHEEGQSKIQFYVLEDKAGKNIISFYLKTWNFKLENVDLFNFLFLQC